MYFEQISKRKKVMNSMAMLRPTGHMIYVLMLRHDTAYEEKKMNYLTR